MIVTTYCTAQSLILQLISSDELLVLLWVSVIEVTVGGGPIVLMWNFAFIRVHKLLVSTSLVGQTYQREKGGGAK